MRRAAKVDENQKLIVEFLRVAGASVYPIGLPVDLLIGYQGKTALAEVKNRTSQYGRRGLNANQKEFATNFKGAPIAVLDSIESAQIFLKTLAQT